MKSLIGKMLIMIILVTIKKRQLGSGFADLKVLEMH